MTAVCFISETGIPDRPIRDASVRYRCFHPAEALVAQGDFASVYSAARFFSEPNLEYDVYVFHRPRADRTSFSEIVRHLRKANKTLIADYDDLIFGDREIALQSSILASGRVSAERALSIFEQNLHAMLMFDKIQTSTEPLAQHAIALNPNADVRVVPNAVSASIASIHQQLETHMRMRPTTSIGYFAGSRSHDRDLSIVGPALQRVLTESADFSLLVVGPVALPADLAALPNVIVGETVDYLRLPSLMASCATVIAPLEITEFTACKSRVKFLEAALSGSRLVATPIPDMLGLGSARMEFASTADEWYEALSNVSGSGEDARKRDNFEFVRRESCMTELSTFWRR